MPAMRRGAGPGKSVGGLAGSATGGAGNGSRLPSSGSCSPGQRGERRAGDPGALHEFELPRDVGVETQEVDAALAVVRGTLGRAPRRDRAWCRIRGRAAGCGESGPRRSHRPRIEGTATRCCCAARVVWMKSDRGRAERSIPAWSARCRAVPCARPACRRCADWRGGYARRSGSSARPDRCRTESHCCLRGAR